jgi:hypothetical protein
MCGLKYGVNKLYVIWSRKLDVNLLIAVDWKSKVTMQYIHHD